MVTSIVSQCSQKRIKKGQINKIVKEKTPNKHDDEALTFEEQVLNLLSNLRLSVDRFQDTAEGMQREIKEFRASIHGEEID